MSERTFLSDLSIFTSRMALSDVPADVIGLARLHILDAIGTSVGALRTEAGQIVARAFDSADRSGPSAIVATGRRTSVGTASFVNTQLSAALDLGANLFNSQGLSGLVTFGPLALGECERASGARLLEALLAGIEGGARVALAFPMPARGWDSDRVRAAAGEAGTTRWITIAGAAANARMRGLDPDRTAHALALAAASIPARVGAKMSLKGDPPPMVKQKIFGNMALAAYVSTAMAEEGFTGETDILDASEGFAPPPAALGWCIRRAGFKRYASATHNQHALHEVERMVREHGVDPEKVRRVRVARAIATGGQFAEASPGSEGAAHFSLPYGIANVLLGHPRRAWGRHLRDPQVQRLAAVVELAHDEEAAERWAKLPAIEQRSPWSHRTRVRIEMDGGEWEQWSEYGDVTEAELTEKFIHHCEGILDPALISRIVERVTAIERLEDVGELVAR